MTSAAGSAAGSGLRAVVPLEGRGDLPFHTLHGTPLLVHAATALRGLGPVVVTGDPAQRRRAVRLLAGRAAVAAPETVWAARPQRVLLHDCLCPLVPRAFLEQVAGEGACTAAYRPVTDTIKVVQDGRTVGTLDRERYAVVTSPLLLVGVEERPPTEDFAATVLWLRERTPVALLEAPSIGRRAADPGAIRVLESVQALARAARGG